MTLDARTREEPKEVLQELEVHAGWIGHFRGSENEPFYDQAFDWIAQRFGPAASERVLDAGCGSGTKTLHLARRGYQVLGLDLSHAMLQQASAAAETAGVAARVEFRQADLTNLALPSQSVRRALCWGVLMHIPDVEKAVAELARIVEPGGMLIVSEGNRRSLHAIMMRVLKRLFGQRAEVLSRPSGLEFWEQTASGRFMTRQADIPWLIREFRKHGLTLDTRHAGQFSEIFTRLPWKPLRSFVHGFNRLWFRYIGWGAPAFGNLLVFRRPPAA